jgi:hypothetical protein
MSRPAVFVFMLALAAARPAVADGRRITNAANVRLRVGPGMDAAVLAEVPLGTELTVVDHTSAADPWYHIKTADGREGWVLGSLTTPLLPERRDQILESIAAARLASGGNFPVRVQLFDFIERSAARLADRETQARFALYRLQSMSLLLQAIPFQGKDPLYQQWIGAHQDVARYDDPGGGWMVDPTYIQMMHDMFRDTAVADDIAWLYVTNRLGGECEGDVPCYASWQDRLNGWYLRSHPDGRHVDDANANLASSFDGILDNFSRFPAVLAEFDRKTRCGELRQLLGALKAAVEASTSVRREDALAAIERYAKLCR